MMSLQAGTSTASTAPGLVLRDTGIAETERFMRLPEVVAVCGLPASSIYDRMRRGEFPKPVPLAGKSVAWLSSEIRQWMQSRIASRRT
ncbi:AlpA family transcriptional regulator [Cupriavidus sp. DL-D2]|uniref:helix-turn-helix transcriptional regulator n=1 Tax=Cupriavidus sp. DL-D2 TaxID=3144974 RepID=UPI0032141BDE